VYKCIPKLKRQSKSETRLQVQEEERYMEVPVERISYKDVEMTVEYDRQVVGYFQPVLSLRRAPSLPPSLPSLLSLSLSLSLSLALSLALFLSLSLSHSLSLSE
jgi:hypothetical protein